MSLQRLWIALGNKQSISDGSTQAGQLPKIDQIDAEVMSLYKDAMN